MGSEKVSVILLDIFPAKIHNQLFCLAHIWEEIVFLVPEYQVLHYVIIDNLTVNLTMGLEQSVLWEYSRQLRTQPCKVTVLSAGLDEMWLLTWTTSGLLIQNQSQSSTALDLTDMLERTFCIKCRAIINEQGPHAISLPVLHVLNSSVQDKRYCVRFYSITQK